MSTPILGLPLAVAICSSVALTVPAGAQCGLIADLTPGTANNTNIDGLVAAFGQELYFAYYSATLGAELWRWTATGGAQIVADLAPGSYGSNPDQITPYCTQNGPRVFYSGFEIGHGYELYMSDGTAGGTGRLKEISPGSSSSLPFDFVGSGGKVFFTANDGVNGQELWVTDGTTVGTVRLSDFAPNSGNGRPNDMIDLGGKVVFSAYDPNTGRELFVSDGTVAGTHLLFDIEPGSTASNPDGFTRVGDTVYFLATTSANGREIWRTDGTSSGTMMIGDMFSTNSFGPHGLCACGDRLFFHEWNGSNQGDIYVTDGTLAGTVNLGAFGANLTCSGDRVFFRGTHFQSGGELWTSDGTIAGTHLVADLMPGPFGSNPSKITACGSGVCFVAQSSVTGELWFSDGTGAGTTMLCLLDPGGNAGPDQLTMCRGRLFMQAYSPSVGSELFGIATPGASTALLGGGGASDYPTLRTASGAAPVLGTTVGLEGSGPAGYNGVILVGGAGLPDPVPNIPGLIDGGCDWVGLQGGTALTYTTVFSSTFVVPFSVPSNVGYEGLVLQFQTVWFHPTALPTLQVSNGLQLVLGTAAPH